MAVKRCRVLLLLEDVFTVATPASLACLSTLPLLLNSTVLLLTLLALFTGLFTTHLVFFSIFRREIEFCELCSLLKKCSSEKGEDKQLVIKTS